MASRRAQAPARQVAPSGDVRGRLGSVRTTLVRYLVGAAAVAVLTLAGILVLGGRLGPFVLLGAVVLTAGLIHRAVRPRLAGAALDDQDRVIQTLAGGMLVLSVVLAAAGAVLTGLA